MGLYRLPREDIEDVSSAISHGTPLTECEDCISRFEVTEILNSEYDIDKMLDRVDKLPSVYPKIDESELHKVAKEELKALVKESMDIDSVLEDIISDIDDWQETIRQTGLNADTANDLTLLGRVKEIVREHMSGKE